MTKESVLKIPDRFNKISPSNNSISVISGIVCVHTVVYHQEFSSKQKKVEIPIVFNALGKCINYFRAKLILKDRKEKQYTVHFLSLVWKNNLGGLVLVKF